jgi:hypothetical protein
MLRRRGHPDYHYAATTRSRQDPKRGEAIRVRDIDEVIIKGVIAYIDRVKDERKRRLFIVQVNEIDV